MQTINVPAGTGVTIRIESNAVGQTEAKVAEVEIAVRSAVGLQPLYKVQYLSAAGNLATYGVFWECRTATDAQEWRSNGKANTLLPRVLCER